MRDRTNDTSLDSIYFITSNPDSALYVPLEVRKYVRGRISYDREIRIIYETDPSRLIDRIKKCEFDSNTKGYEGAIFCSFDADVIGSLTERNIKCYHIEIHIVS